jgi:hypothetical protein
MMKELQSSRFRKTRLKETKQLWYTVAGMSRRRGSLGHGTSGVGQEVADHGAAPPTYRATLPPTWMPVGSRLVPIIAVAKTDQRRSRVRSDYTSERPLWPCIDTRSSCRCIATAEQTTA